MRGGLYTGDTLLGISADKRKVKIRTRTSSYTLGNLRDKFFKMA